MNQNEKKTILLIDDAKLLRKAVVDILTAANTPYEA